MTNSNSVLPARDDRVDAPVDGEVRVEGDAGAVVGGDGALVREAVTEDGEDTGAEAVRGEQAAVVHHGGHVATAILGNEIYGFGSCYNCKTSDLVSSE